MCSHFGSCVLKRAKSTPAMSSPKGKGKGKDPAPPPPGPSAGGGMLSSVASGVGTLVEGFDRRGTEPFELFRSEFGQNSVRIKEILLEF